MAYAGEISFMQIPFEGVSWNMDIRGPFKTDEKDARGDRLEAEARKLDFVGTDKERGRLVRNVGEQEEASSRFLRFDEADVTDRPYRGRLRYVVLGRDGDWDGLDRDRCASCYYVLIIRASEGGPDKTYERVGVGSLRKKDLSTHGKRVFVV